MAFEPRYTLCNVCRQPIVEYEPGKYKHTNLRVVDSPHKAEPLVDEDWEELEAGASGG